MLFSSVVFIYLFLPIVLFGYYIVFKKSRKLQNIFLLISSLFFYAWGEAVFVIVMISSIMINWLLGYLVNKYKSDNKKCRLIIAVTVVLNLSVMFIFKYLMFTVQSINSAFGSSFFVPNIILPIGISFFTFQAMSYVFDVHKGHGEAQRNPINVGLYVAFFPQLIAGPIVRYETIAQQINDRKETLDDFSKGFCRFVVGFSKKVLLANTMALIADTAFDMPSNELTVAMSWLGAFAYAFQIFFDFSGYSDMAIGLGHMFGFSFLENFNYPYISKSISEFWRRWHISLGTWFRDYVYFPLGGSRTKTKSRLIFNLFVVWFLTGVWHGANWTFIVWGLMYFVLIAIEKLTGFEKRFTNLTFLKYLYTMFFVLMGWVLFRATSIANAFEYMKVMLGISGNSVYTAEVWYLLKPNLILILACALASAPIVPWIKEKFKSQKVFFNIMYAPLILIIFILSLSYIIKGSYNPFIYFNF
ncbi:MAG: MBOAT family protein [Clostridiales bacterium]|nr:MBOAT family protein [Clostridiales bacterium]